MGLMVLMLAITFNISIRRDGTEKDEENDNSLFFSFGFGDQSKYIQKIQYYYFKYMYIKSYLIDV